MEAIDLSVLYIVELVLWAGSFGVAGFLAGLVSVSAYVGYLIGRRSK
jgi:hypothetical protein